ncbi:histidine phosphatase family protein [Mesorhizobium sp.]|uniref:histidine phosphatase family protein n=1 Tax=Mesorhizobium sp. TaxID=1871066 RepID=UPI0025CF6A62|nr:histidine phosphatase family protein [Mesorhizobium sp.]
MAPTGITTFWVARHGDTDKYLKDGALTTVAEKIIDGEKHWYTQGGDNNNPLSAVGFAQALALAPLVATEPITNIRCSPVGRAVSTGTLCQKVYIPMQFDDKLKECGYGKWEYGYAPLAVFKGQDPDTQDSGEFSKNVMQALEACRERGQLLVAHGNVVRTIAGALGVSLSRADCANAQLLRFEKPGAYWTVTNLSATQ